MIILSYYLEESDTTVKTGHERDISLKIPQLDRFAGDPRTENVAMIACEAILVFAAHTRRSSGQLTRIANPFSRLHPQHEWLTLESFGYPPVDPWDPLRETL